MEAEHRGDHAASARSDEPDRAGSLDRDTLVLEHLWLAERCAAGYTGRGEPYDDLYQVAVVGLIKAAQRFDPERRVPFEAFAVPTIKGEVRHHFRDQSWGVHVPGHVKELRAELHHAIACLEQRLGRAPGADEVADELHVAVSTLDAARRADRVYEVQSLEAIGAREGIESSIESVADVGGDDSMSATARVEALDALGYLDDRERAIVYWRFFEDRTQQEIATRLGIGQAHVSRLLNQALRNLATRLGAVARTAPGTDGVDAPRSA